MQCTMLMLARLLQETPFEEMLEFTYCLIVSFRIFIHKHKSRHHVIILNSRGGRQAEQAAQGAATPCCITGSMVGRQSFESITKSPAIWHKFSLYLSQIDPVMQHPTDTHQRTFSPREIPQKFYDKIQLFSSRERIFKHRISHKISVTRKKFACGAISRLLKAS